MKGYIKLYRSIWTNNVVNKDAEHLAIWVWILTHATFNAKTVEFNKKHINLEAGQITTGRKIIARDTKVSESKVQRVLKEFELDGLIIQKTDNRCRLITVVDWSIYQKGVK